MNIAITKQATEWKNHIRECLVRADLAYWNVLLIILYTLGMGLYFVSTPFNIDDFWFMEYLRDFYQSQGVLLSGEVPNLSSPDFPWGKMWETITWRWGFDNARFSNVLAIPCMILPVSYTKTIIWLCWMYCVYAAIRIIGIDWRRSPLLPFMLFCFTFIMPWRDGQCSAVYGFNYIVPTLLGILLIRLLQNQRQDAIQLIKIGLCSFFLGWWHEGFSIPMILGILTVLIVSKKLRDVRYYIAMICMVAGLSIIIAAPSLLFRLMNVQNRPEHRFIPNLYKTVLINLPFYFFVALTGVQTCKHGMKWFKSEPLLSITLASGIGSTALLLTTMVQSRVCWWSIYLSIISILLICKRIYPHLAKHYNRITAFSGIIISTVTLAEIGVTDFYSVNIARDWQLASENYSKNPGSVYFGKSYTYDRVPRFITPMFNVYQYSSSIDFMNTSYIKDDNKPFAIVPEDLRNVDEHSGTPVDGNFNVRILDGRLFRPWKEEIEPPQCGYSTTGFEINYGFGYVVRPAAYTLFRSEKDGQLYHYILPNPTYLHACFGKIKGFRVIENQ